MSNTTSIIKNIFRNNYLAVDDFPSYLKIYEELKVDNEEINNIEKLSKIMIQSFRKTIIDNKEIIKTDKLNTEIFINCYVESYVTKGLPYTNEEEKETATNLIKYFNQPINRNAFKGVLIKNEKQILDEIYQSNISSEDIENDNTLISLEINNKKHNITTSAIADYLKKDYYQIIEKEKEDKFYEDLTNNFYKLLEKNNYDLNLANQIINNSTQTVLTNNNYIEYLENKRQEYYEENTK